MANTAPNLATEPTGFVAWVFKNTEHIDLIAPTLGGNHIEPVSKLLERASEGEAGLALELAESPHHTRIELGRGPHGLWILVRRRRCHDQQVARHSNTGSSIDVLFTPTLRGYRFDGEVSPSRLVDFVCDVLECDEVPKHWFVQRVPDAPAAPRMLDEEVDRNV